MAILDVVNGWVEGFKVVRGIADKVYSEANTGEGIVCHSVEGDDRIDDIPDRFLDTSKLPNGQYTANAAASCIFINPLEDDHLNIQMYTVDSSTWTSGNRKANTTLWPVETEGRAGQPLTARQRLRMWQIVTAWERWSGKRATRGDANGNGRNIWQHNEVWNWSAQNAGPTACPSNRYDGFFAELADRNRKLDAGEITVTPLEWEQMKVRVSTIENLIIGKSGDATAVKAMNDRHKTVGTLAQNIDDYGRQDGTLDKRLDAIEAAIAEIVRGGGLPAGEYDIIGKLRVP